MSFSSRRSRPSAPRSPQSMPKNVVSSEISSNSRTPRSASARASRTIESADRLRVQPRSVGMMQNAHV